MPKKLSKKIKKIVKKQPKGIRYLFRKDKVEQKKKEGWKLISITGMANELALMEKK